MVRGTLAAMVMAGLGATGVAAEPVAITGLVAYREQLRLPPAATTAVRLVEAGGDGDPVAEVTVTDRATPPIPFTLEYDSGVLDPQAAYALEAVISLGEQVLFAGEKPRPVADPATSQKVSIVVRLQRP